MTNFSVLSFGSDHVNEASSSFGAATHVSGSHSCVFEGDKDPFAALWVQSNNYELETESI